MIQTKKLGTDCTEELYNLVNEASEIERRNVSNFIRLACEERAKKILSVKNDTTDN